MENRSVKRTIKHIKRLLSAIEFVLPRLESIRFIFSYIYTFLLKTSINGSMSFIKLGACGQFIRSFLQKL